MQFQQFRVPAFDGEGELEKFNTFLRANKILKVDRKFVDNGNDSSWLMLVEYLPIKNCEKSTKKPKIDYREVLSADDFVIFDKLRRARKSFAERDGVPAYAVFTNEQLAAMVTGRITTVTALKKLEGVGETRVERYAAILEVMREAIG